MEPAVSIIVCTYNGAKKLPTLLSAIKKQTNQKFELVIVIDGSIDETSQVLNDYEKLFSSCKIIWQTNQGRSKVRNRGALEATGDLLVFYDDDMEPFPNSIERHLQFHQRQGGLLSGNPIEIPGPGKTDIQNYKAHRTKRWTARYPEGVSQLDERQLFFTTANCSIRKQDFIDLGGFNDRLTDAEDYELALRALRGGFPVYFDKANRAIHHDNITCLSYIKRIRQYKVAHKHLQEIYPDLNRKSARSNWIRKAVYRLFAFPVLVNMIDRERLKWIPRAMRFKIYGVIIHSLGIEFSEIEI